MKVKNRLAPVQMLTMTVSTMFGVHILVVQYYLVEKAGRDAWISMLLFGLLGLLIAIVCIIPLTKMYPQNDLPEITIMLFGKLWGRVLFLPVTFYVLFELGLNIRIFVQATKIFLLKRTPITVVIVLAVITMASLAKRDINSIGSAIDFMFPVYLFPLILLIGLAFSQADYYRIQPILYKNWLGVAKGGLPAYSAILGSSIIAYVFRYVPEKKKAAKWFISGYMIGIIIYTLIIFVTLVVFEQEDIKRMVYPTLSLARMIEFPVTLLERLESIILVIWIPGIFAYSTLYYFASVRNISTFLSIKPEYHNYVAYAHIPVFIAIALFPSNEIESLEALMKVCIMGTFASVMLLPLRVIAALLRRKRKLGGGNQ